MTKRMKRSEYSGSAAQLPYTIRVPNMESNLSNMNWCKETIDQLIAENQAIRQTTIDQCISICQEYANSGGNAIPLIIAGLTGMRYSFPKIKVPRKAPTYPTEPAYQVTCQIPQHSTN